MEQTNCLPSKKRTSSSSNEQQQQTGPAGHSLLDSLKLGSEGDRIPVELLQVSNESDTNKCTTESSLQSNASNPTAITSLR